MSTGLSRVPSSRTAQTLTGVGVRLMTSVPTARTGDEAGTVNAATRWPAAVPARAARMPARKGRILLWSAMQRHSSRLFPRMGEDDPVASYTVNPDAVAEPNAVAVLSAFLDTHPRAGIAGPRMLWTDGSFQPSRRRFPTVAGTLVRRTPLRFLAQPYARQRAHYYLDAPEDEPQQVDWMLCAFLLMRR